MKIAVSRGKLALSVGSLLALGGPVVAFADAVISPQYAFDLTPSTDYVFRGVSQNENNPVLFAWSKVSYRAFYATLGAENVDFNNGTHAEYDVSVGWSKRLAGYTVDLGVIRYGYIGAPYRIDTTELRGIVSHRLGSMTLGGAVFHTSNYFGSKNSATYVEGNLAFPIIRALSGSVAFGRQAVNRGDDYSTWNAGSSYALNAHVAVDVRYYDTVAHATTKVAGNHIVASIRISM